MTSIGGLIVLGSVQAEMNSLLQDSRTPLFGRTTFNLNLGPWELRTVFQVSDLHRADDPNRFLTLWTLFGGVPKYWRHFAEVEDVDLIPNWSDWAAEVCAGLFLRTGAPLQQEGEVLLQHEVRDLLDFRNRLHRSDAGATGAFAVSDKVAGRD